MAGGVDKGPMSQEGLAPLRLAFFEECGEHLVALERGLMALDEGQTDPEILNAVFRAVHSIKGGAAIFGMDHLAGYAHTVESALAAMRERGSAPPAAPRVLLKAADALADLVAAARDDQAVDAAAMDALMDEVRGLAQAPAAADAPPVGEAEAGAAEPEDEFGLDFTPMPVDFEPIPAAAPAVGWRIAFRPRASLYPTANEPLVLLRELRRLAPCRIEADLGDLPLLDALDPDGAYIGWTITVEDEVDLASLQSVFEFVDADCDLAFEPLAAELPASAAIQFDWTGPIASPPAEPPAPAAALKVDPPADRADAATPRPASRPPDAPQAAPAPAASLRVDLHRVDRLIDLMSELVTSEATLSERVAAIRGPEGVAAAAAVDDLRALTRDLQESVMAIRSQSLRSVLQRMSRLVRETEARTGKQARLVTQGEETEVDRAIIEGLVDPLTHMIRNAIDHGLETAERRLETGKPAEGVIRITAAHRGGRVVIEVADDGAGINHARVREIAVSRGLIAADQALTEDEIENLIFEPGFSTASSVTDLSGRGVGMDVVRKSVQALGGRITVSSRPGLGSTFTMSLPLTLAVMDGMLVTVHGERMVVPLNAVLESIKPRLADTRTLGPQASLLSIRGNQVPYIDLAMALGYRTASAPPDQGIALLVESDAGEPIAIQVDEIVDQRQVVIKSLEANYRALKGIAAATILGDGTVALILDVNGLIEARRHRAGGTERVLAHA
ncbi:MAG: chemotaxis protein CheA [Pseudomonadota bacterium]